MELVDMRDSKSRGATRVGSTPTGATTSMISAVQRKKIIKYYRTPESRWGYHHFLWGAKHFGYYPNKKSDITEQKAQMLLQDLVAKKLGLRKNMVILDAGCGEGVVAVFLADKYSAHITGVTLVPFEKKAAIKRAQSRGTSKLNSFEVMDYTSTEFPDNHFDGVYTTESLSHIPHPADALREFYRLLKPGGKLALFEYTIANDSEFSAHEMKMLELVIDGSGMFGLKKIRHDQLINDISSAGFVDVHQDNISDNIKPSFLRLNQSASGPYKIINKLKLHQTFINTTASVEYFNMAQKDLIRYYIFSARKPKSG